MPASFCVVSVCDFKKRGGNGLLKIVEPISLFVSQKGIVLIPNWPEVETPKTPV